MCRPMLYVCGTAFGQVQSFVVRPTDVSVVEGHTAILHCQVAHMKGQLQWTKNGFALGISLRPASIQSYRCKLLRLLDVLYRLPTV